MSIDNVKNALSKKYEFFKLIGKGGFAEVYLAKDKLLEREVAIKILLSQHAGDSEVIERFIREAKLYAKFDHKNLIPIYETGIVENNAFLVMKYVNGNSLKEIIEKKGALNSVLTLKVVKGMASALNYIHNKGIIHRDIKPANILIENDTNRVFLADFGIARPISSKTLTQTGMLIGTPYYISPEQIKKGIADKRSDIYALGTTLYEIISGTPIFKCETPIEVLYKHVNEDPKPIASINPNITMEMKHIVEKCLEKDPNDRFQNANEILDLIATGETKQIKNKYKKERNRSLKSWIFKLGFLIFFVGLIFIFYQYTPLLDFLKQKEINNSKGLVKKENKEIKNGEKETKEITKEENKKDTITEKKNTSEIEDQEKENTNNIAEKIVKIEKTGNKKEMDLLKKDKIETPKISFEDKKYKEFFDLSKSYYDRSEFTSADKYLKRAKKHKETLELFQLDEKIKIQLKRIKKEEKKKILIKKSLKRVSLFKLKPELNKSYIAKINNVRIIVLKKKIFFMTKVAIRGQLTVKLKIDENGKLSFQEINQDNLIINPLSAKKNILRRIWIKLKSIRFLPPVDKNGNKVILKNWRVTFIVSKYKNKIILKRKV